MEIVRQGFRKEERLRSVKEIAALFSEGKSAVTYPIKIVWKITDSEFPFSAKAAFSVSSRVFKNAVDRNLLKRRMKEAYRKNKHDFYTALGETKINIMFVYIAKEKLDYSRIEISVVTALKKVIRVTAHHT